MQGLADGGAKNNMVLSFKTSGANMQVTINGKSQGQVDPNYHRSIHFPPHNITNEANLTPEFVQIVLYQVASKALCDAFCGIYVDGKCVSPSLKQDIASNVFSWF